VNARRRGIAVLLANNGLMSAGFYLLIPLLSVHLTRDLGLSGAAAGGVLALRQVTQQGLMLFGGALADRVGYRSVIAAGMAVRALGFFGFGLGDSLPVILVSAVVAALGGALFEATGKAALALLAGPHERPRYFSLSALVAGAGTTLGPLLGTALLAFSFAWVGIAAGAFFAAACLLSALLLPAMRAEHAIGTAGSFGRTMRALARRRGLLVFTVLLTGYWFLHNQVYVSIPLRALQVTGGASAVGVLYAVNAIAGMALQYPLVRLAARWMSPAAAVAVGVATIGAGLGLVAFAGTAPANSSGVLPVLVMAAGMVIFAAGRALVEPMKDVVTAALAPPDELAAAYGFAFLALAVGGSLGNYAGGWLFDYATATGRFALPWALFAAFGALAGAALLAFARAATTPSNAAPAVRAVAG
jgi:DHA1 family multidrug resistance protein-like MFS transporter